MNCNGKTKPELTPEQIEKCKQCKFASAKEIWCCKFGFYFDKPLIIIPSKKIVSKLDLRPPSEYLPPETFQGLPNDRYNKIQKPDRPCPKPSLMEMTKNFATAMVRWTRSGLKCVDKKTYIKRLLICSDCTNCRTCPKCGCYLKAKAALATEKCPEGKW